MNNRMYPTVELVLLVIGALVIIFALSVVRGMLDAEREQRERDGLPPRPGFVTRLARWAKARLRDALPARRAPRTLEDQQFAWWFAFVLGFTWLVMAIDRLLPFAFDVAHLVDLVDGGIGAVIAAHAFNRHDRLTIAIYERDHPRVLHITAVGLTPLEITPFKSTRTEVTK